MKYYWLSTEDEPQVNWILFRAKPARELRGRYQSLACPSCGRVDELASLRFGVDSGVLLRSKLDYFTTDDGFKCITRRGREIFENCGTTGLEFIPLPNQQQVSAGLNCYKPVNEGNPNA